MARRALIFPETDALVATLESRLISGDVLAREVEFQTLEPGVLAVAPGRSLDKAALTAIGKLGIETRSLDGEWTSAPCWPALLRPQGSAEEERPRSCLFVLPDESSTIGLVAELLRLGCDRASFATFDSSDGNEAFALVRAFEPPYYTVIRGTGEGAPFVPYVPALSGREDVWIEFGYEHRLASAIRVGDNEKLLIGGDGEWRSFVADEWTDVLEIADVRVRGARRAHAGAPLEQKLEVPLRLRDASRNQSPTLWVIEDDADAQVQALISSLPDDVVGRLLFAVGDNSDGERLVVLRARPGRGAPPQIDVRGTAFVSHVGIANLFVPVGVAIEPPLRRDTLRDHLAPDPGLVVWVVADETAGDGVFGLDTIEESSFAPLADWVEYTLARADDVLETWVAGAAFETSAFQSIGTEWAAAGAEPREEKAPKPRRRRGNRGTQSEVEDIEDLPPVVVPITVETPSLAALPELDKGDRTTEQLLADLERDFLDDDAPVDSPTRAETWQLMARLHAELGNHRDASLCLLRWLWEAPDSDVAGLASAWFLVSGDESPLDELIELTHPTLDQVRATVAQVTGLVAAGVELPVEASDLQQFLDEHDADLDVRSVWLGRLAISTSVGGDRLALARARDRLLRQMRGGLSLERDVPTFLRFLGAGGGDSAAVSELTRHLEALHVYSGKAKRKRSPVEAPTELTGAYVAFEFAYALARLGQAESARSMRDAAVKLVPTTDAVHSFLVRAYSARVEQAIEGKPTGTPLPPDVSASLNELSKFERYKVDRLRQASTVLEQQERLDPVAAFQRGDSDPRGEEFAALRGMDDVDELNREILRLLAVARESSTKMEDKARLYDGLMDFFPMLRESDAIAALEIVIASVDEVAPKQRALLLEEALMLAGFFGREQSSRDISTTLDALLAELSPSDVVELAAEFGACLRSLRRVGLAERATSLLERLASAIVGDSVDATLARLQVAAGRAYLGQFKSVEETLVAAQKLVESGDLVAADRLRVIRGLARAWTFAPTERASEGLRELAQQLPSITDSYNTNSHFCLSVIAFVDAIVLGFAGGELALGDVGRRWLDEDEYLVRRRIHRDLESV